MSERILHVEVTVPIREGQDTPQTSSAIECALSDALRHWEDVEDSRRITMRTSWERIP